jgi:hypothetical protein
MNFENPVDLERFLNEVQQTQTILRDIQIEALGKAEAKIDALFSFESCPFSEEDKDIYRELILSFWLLGYTTGVSNISKYMAEELSPGAKLSAEKIAKKLGATGSLDCLTMIEKISKSNLKNN